MQYYASAGCTPSLPRAVLKCKSWCGMATLYWSQGKEAKSHIHCIFFNTQCIAVLTLFELSRWARPGHIIVPADKDCFTAIVGLEGQISGIHSQEGAAVGRLLTSLIGLDRNMYTTETSQRANSIYCYILLLKNTAVYSYSTRQWPSSTMHSIALGRIRVNMRWGNLSGVLQMLMGRPLPWPLGPGTTWLTALRLPTMMATR